MRLDIKIEYGILDQNTSRAKGLERQILARVPESEVTMDRTTGLTVTCNGRLVFSKVKIDRFHQYFQE